MATAKDLQSLSDQEVVALARAGREVAYRELLHRYERPVFSLVYRMVRDRETAEDLAQETFVKVLNALDSYRPEYRFSSWIFKIANNAAIDHLRRRELNTLSLDGAPGAVTPSEVEATALQAADHSPSPLAELESRELGTAIEQAVAKLRPDYRACILLRHVEGRAYEEIAETLDLPLGTVKTYIHRARLELRDHLAHLKDE
jgi:RNA polymerase sigma-70 factor (ECF subfamily)